jgi:threonine/homoserine/homoserine lactone efflux protein
MSHIDPLLVAYVSFTTLLVVTPGSTTAVVVRNTLQGGRGAGLAAAMGAALGNSSHAALAGLGVAVLFVRWPWLPMLLRFAGGSYLAWLGCHSIYRALKHPDGGLRLARAHEPSTTSPRPDRVSSLRQGLLVNLLNPAIATFYLVVVPTFVPSSASRIYFVFLALIHVGLAFVCHGVWAVALDRLRRVFNAPAARRTLEGLTAVALITLAIRVWLA